jgi:hypothetical protein
MFKIFKVRSGADNSVSAELGPVFDREDGDAGQVVFKGRETSFQQVMLQRCVSVKMKRQEREKKGEKTGMPGDYPHSVTTLFLMA